MSARPEPLLLAKLRGPAAPGALALEIDLALGAETLVLAGPNGAGKSTLLACLLGLRAAEAGTISWAGEPLFARGGGASGSARGGRGDIDVPPEQRHFGWVPQGESLFPYLTAMQNIEFAVAARAPRVAKGERRERARALLERLGCVELAPRPAAALSGGERQKIALARALASAPRALLLDEPLSALDASARPAVRDFLAAALRELKLPALLVTHDQEDARALGAQVQLLEQGRTTQRGTLAELARSPGTPFAARFTQP